MNEPLPQSPPTLRTLAFSLDGWRQRNPRIVSALYVLTCTQFVLRQADALVHLPFTSAWIERFIDVLPLVWFLSLGISVGFLVLPYLVKYYLARDHGVKIADAMSLGARPMTGSVLWDGIIFAVIFLGGLGFVAWIVASMGQFHAR